jgi:hypothetical protein
MEPAIPYMITNRLAQRPIGSDSRPVHAYTACRSLSSELCELTHANHRSVSLLADYAASLRLPRFGMASDDPNGTREANDDKR